MIKEYALTVNLHLIEPPVMADRVMHIRLYLNNIGQPVILEKGTKIYLDLDKCQNGDSKYAPELIFSEEPVDSSFNKDGDLIIHNFKGLDVYGREHLAVSYAHSEIIADGELCLMNMTTGECVTESNIGRFVIPYSEYME